MKLAQISLIVLLVCMSACQSPSDAMLANGGIGRTPADNGGRSSGLRSLAPELTAARLRALQTKTGEYKLGGGDVVSLWAEDIVELNRKFVLGPDGKVTIPGIGVVNFGGLTRTEAMKLVEGRLKAHYRDPKVSLLVEAYTNNRISILGEVKTPGEFSFAGNTSLLNVLAKAGGPTEKANLQTCMIVRGRAVIAQIDLRDLLQKGDLSLNIPLQPNDAVYLSAKPSEEIKLESTFFVLGEVKNPGVFPIAAKGKDVMDPLRAISMAGGNTDDAAMSKVRIVRRNKTGAPTTIKVDLEDVLDGKRIKLPEVFPGDIVYVPRKGLATFR